MAFFKRGLLTALFASFFMWMLQAQDPARVQFIHNAADPAAETVDVYFVIFGDTTLLPLLDDFSFRTATPFLLIPSGIPIEMVIAPGSSSSAQEGVASFDLVLDPSEFYYLVANGVVDTGFADNPDGIDIAFNLFPIPEAREMGVDPSLVDLTVFHGSPDAPTVGLDANSETLIPGFSYADFTGFFSVPPDAYQLDITWEDQALFSFNADLSEAAGKSAFILASGFVDPAANNNGASFVLLMVNPDGTVVILRPEIPGSSLRVLDEENNVLLTRLTDGGVIDLAQTGDVPLNIQLIPGVAGVGSVAFDLQGPLSFARIENEVPYLNFGDDPKDPEKNFARKLPLGSYLLTYQVFSDLNGSGDQLDSATVSFEVVDSSLLFARSFDAIDKEKNIVIEDLKDGDVISLTAIGDIPLNFQANFDQKPGSVRMELSGPLSFMMPEHFEPYTVFGDDPESTQNNAQKLPVGEYTLTATPFELPHFKGEVGTAVSIKFTVVDGSPELVDNRNRGELVQKGILQVYPNPASRQLHFQFSDDHSGRIDVFIFHSSGKLVRQFNFAKAEGSIVGSVDLSDLGSGIYYLRTVVGGDAQNKRFLLVD